MSGHWRRGSATRRSGQARDAMIAVCRCNQCVAEKQAAIQLRMDSRRRACEAIRAWTEGRRRRGVDDPLVVKACRLLNDPSLAHAVCVKPLLDDDVNGICYPDVGRIDINVDSRAYQVA